MHPLLKNAVRSVLHARAGWQIGRDVSTASPEAARLLRVVAHTLGDQFSPGDRAWFSRVEAMRATLAASAEPIQLTDFGAGTPASTRTAEEMRRGVAYQSTVGNICRGASKAPFWTRLLFALVREYRPQHGIELGTSLGVSAAYQGAALALGPQPASLVTMEGAAELAVHAQRNLDELGLGSFVSVVTGRFDQTLPPLLADPRHIDYAFIDGHHDGQATIDYFSALKPRLAPGAVLVFDDIAWSPGMKRAWQTICADSCFAVTLDLHTVGIGVIGASGHRHYRYYMQ